MPLKLCRVRDATLRPILVLTTRFFGTTGSLTAQRTGSLIRPLMSISRDDVKKLCRFWELPIYPDVTNQEIAFTRNRIRKQVFPTLRLALNPQIDNVLSQSAEILLAERLHGDLLASKLSRASQPIAALGACRPAQAGGGPTKHQSPQNCFDARVGPSEGYTLKGYYALPFEPPNGRTWGGGSKVTLASLAMHAQQGPRGGSCTPVACGSQAAWLRLPEMGGFEMIDKNCHWQKRCGRLLFQRSTCLFLPQVGVVFANSAPPLTRKIY